MVPVASAGNFELFLLRYDYDSLRAFSAASRLFLASSSACSKDNHLVHSNMHQDVRSLSLQNWVGYQEKCMSDKITFETSSNATLEM
jgi:hypothetical protein